MNVLDHSVKRFKYINIYNRDIALFGFVKFCILVL